MQKSKEMHLNSPSQIKFNIAYIKLFTQTEGPFGRCCIWFQGCNIRCPGCCNKELQSFKPNHFVSLNKLLDIIKSAKEKFNIEGVTLSGGEPTLQLGLVELNKGIRELGLGIIMFSGKNKDFISDDIVKSVDLLIDGPFIKKELDTNRFLLGSKNKKLNFITDRYKKEADYFNCSISKEEICTDDYIFINGD